MRAGSKPLTHPCVPVPSPGSPLQEERIGRDGWMANGWRDGGMGGSFKKEGDRCIHIVDSFHCIAETNTAL